MLRTSARRGMAGGTALLVGLAGIALGQAAAHASPPLPAGLAGPVAVWGPGDTTDGFPLPSPTASQSSEAFTKVVANSQSSAIGLTASGTVELLGTNNFVDLYHYASDAIPADLAGKKVVDIAGDANYGNGMAITDTGSVYTWNLGIEGWATTDVPTASQLQGSKAGAIAPAGQLAAVVKQDGSVLVWGDALTAGSGIDYGQLTPPAGLTGVTSVFFSADSEDLYALKSDGTLVAWGRDDDGRTDLPAVTTDTSDDVSVKDVASNGASAVALLSDGTLAAWGDQTGASGANEPPAALAGKEVDALSSNGDMYFAIDSEGTVYEWGQSGTADPAFAQLPENVDPANITGLSINYDYAIAIQATYGYVSKPTVAGTAKVGQTLTATHATFTAAPDEAPVGQWFADGSAIANATGTTYKLTAAEVGKKITYAETAKRGTETATATSDPTAAVAAAATGGGTTVKPPTGGGTTHVTPPTAAQKKLTKDKAALAKAKKQYKKAHGAKKAKLKKKIAKLKKTIKKDQKNVKAGK